MDSKKDADRDFGSSDCSSVYCEWRLHKSVDGNYWTLVTPASPRGVAFVKPNGSWYVVDADYVQVDHGKEDLISYAKIKAAGVAALLGRI